MAGLAAVLQLPDRFILVVSVYVEGNNHDALLNTIHIPQFEQKSKETNGSYYHGLSHNDEVKGFC